MSNIIPAPQKAAIEISAGKRQQFWKDAKRMVAQGIALGVKGRFMTAAALWNIRELELYKEEGYKTLKAFIEDSEIGQAQFYAFLQVGDRIRGASKSDDPVISQKELKGVFEISHANFQDITVRSLFKAAQSQQSFEKLLTTGNLEEVKTEAAKLLKPRKLSDEERAADAEKEGRAAIAADRAERYGHAWARLHHVVWDHTKKNWVNEDGTELSDEQLTQMTEFSHGMKVWEDVRDNVAEACGKMYTAIHESGNLYKHFTAKDNRKFAAEVKVCFTTATRRLETMQNMLAHLFETDIAEAEKTYKKSI